MQTLVPVSQLSEVNSKPFLYDYNGVPYVLYRKGQTVRAYLSLCSHEYRPFTPTVDHDCLVCPFHKVCFDPATGAVHNAHGKKVPEGLPPVEVKIIDEVVYIAVSDRHQQKMNSTKHLRRARKWDKFLRKLWRSVLPRL
jgi:nitrite reductase/ring-hydroxylating ferredoxin subunit